jgi:hypothetical protein
LGRNNKEATVPYEKSLDVETFKEVKDFGETRITVGVFSYNNGPKKLQIVRENKTQEEEWRYTKLGRMSKDEAQEILPIIMKAVEGM